jgi:phosphatidylglycerol:prolipoprotein diacylglycerol transferase
VPIHAYGSLIVLGAAAGTWLAVRRAPAYGLERFDELAVGLLGFGGGVVGATLLYVLIHLPEFIADPSLLKQPGHVFYGGFAGGALAAWLYCRGYKLSLLRVADAGAPGLALGHAIGRVGCLMAGCCYGKVIGGFRHPVQAYESAGLLLLCALTLALSSRLRPRPGALFAVYLGGYALLRLAMEPLRGDDLERGSLSLFGASFSTGQICAALALGCAASLVIRLRATDGR